MFNEPSNYISELAFKIKKIAKKTERIRSLVKSVCFKSTVSSNPGVQPEDKSFSEVFNALQQQQG